MQGELLGCVQSGDGSPCLRPSGIPPFVEMYKQLQRNDQTLALILETILKGVREIVNENGVCAGNITRTVLESSITNALSLVSQSFGQFIVPTTTHNVPPTVRLALPPHPTEIDAIDAFAATSGLFNVISGETTSKRLRRDCQLKVTTMVRLVRQQDATKYSRPFKKRKLTSPKEPPALGRSLLL
ncbi:hypothetical protein H257_07151 [Aphanomyces astaci]|uniref:Uncharacterized protein n=1 Tax=Aphanomyces astaci TaxID=112090 RepID=W4GM29_APHAT|nr:hypothetical protein H257_07151 [Aphanomyces astaci]ETV79953.1 hypothetical protein H257_07151 [Aphanomyces astaci]|eukprot:XP_009830889.1 hypothetical protein H257_07151 [Aphanomyces astaci]